MRRTVDKAMVNAAMRYATGCPLVYLNNPKAGCGTIKASLWNWLDQQARVKTYAGAPHDRAADPFADDVFAREECDPAALKSAVFFSVVRNPYVRILSAYLNKIVRDNPIWRGFAERFAFPASFTGKDLSFRDFLVILTCEPDELLDVHFRPQYLNLLWPVCRPHFVGRIETMTDVVGFLSQYGVAQTVHRRNTTAADEKLMDYYSDETTELVRKKYADDFRIFGYSTDIGETAEFSAMESGGGDCAALTDWIADGRYPNDRVDEASKRFNRFTVSDKDPEKLQAASEANGSDDNWRRLQAYSDFALQAGEPALAQEIEAKIASVKGRHRALMRDASMFAN